VRDVDDGGGGGGGNNNNNNKNKSKNRNNKNNININETITLTSNNAVERDISKYNRPLSSILHQYINFVKPAFKEFCLPVS